MIVLSKEEEKEVLVNRGKVLATFLKTVLESAKPNTQPMTPVSAHPLLSEMVQRYRGAWIEWLKAMETVYGPDVVLAIMAAADPGEASAKDALARVISAWEGVSDTDPCKKLNKVMTGAKRVLRGLPFEKAEGEK